MKTVKGLRSTNWWLQNRHGDVKVQHGEYSQYYNNYLWFQMGTGNTGDHFLKYMIV